MANDFSLTTQQAAEQITRTNLTWSGTLGHSATVTYAFTGDNGSWLEFNEAEVAATQDALGLWADLANVTFIPAHGPQQYPDVYSARDIALINFIDYYDEKDSSYALTSGDPSPSHHPVTVGFNLAQAGTPEMEPEQYGRASIIHEIGHALGLEHPGNYNAGKVGDPEPTYENDRAYVEDSRQYTVMSYFDAEKTDAVHNGAYAQTPLLDDIVAIQRLYGANMNTRLGDTTYGYNSNADRAAFHVDSASEKPIFAIWDAGGDNDALDFSGSTAAQVIDLAPNSFSSVNGLTSNVAIAPRVWIENATGGSNTDTIYGNAKSNSIGGGDGADTLYGYGGEDIINGDDGNDKLYGGTERDILRGGAGSDDLYGGLDGADDVLEGGSGNDTYYVGEKETIIENINGGNDTVITTLDTYTLPDGEEVENLRVDEFAPGDSFTGYGNSLKNHIVGGGGNDVLFGLAGEDTLDGGAGADTMYGGTEDDIYYVDNPNDRTIEGSLPVDGLHDIVLSKAHDYTLGAFVEDMDLLSGAANGTGNDQNNIITGNDGPNILDGRGGDDILRGGKGADKLIGGDGFDTADYSSLRKSGVIVDLANGSPTDTVNEAAGDTYESIEAVIGTRRHDDISGDDLDNVLDGRGGDNTLNGRGGDDTFIVDTINWDTIDGGSNNAHGDTMSFAGAQQGVEVDLGLLRADFYQTTTEVTPTGGVGVTVTAVGGVIFKDIENLTGTQFTDKLTGDDKANILDGDNGTNTLDGRGGDDTFMVNHIGFSTIDGGSNDSHGDTVVIATTPLYKAEVDLEAKTAKFFIDLVMDSGGAAGFLGFTQPLTPANTTPTVVRSYAPGGASLTDIENVTSGNNDDIISGDDKANIIDGGGGNNILNGRGGDDTFIVDLAGFDTIDGGENGSHGDTVVIASTHLFNAKVDLEAGTARFVSGTFALGNDGGGAAGFLGFTQPLTPANNTPVPAPTPSIVQGVGADLTGIENVTTGNNNDELVGNDKANILSSGDGTDTLTGGRGNDELTGGAKADTFVYADDWDHDIIRDFVVGEDILDMRRVSGLTSLSQLAITDTAEGARIEMVGHTENSIVLNGVSAASLKASPASFLLTAAPAPQTFDGTAFWGSTIQGGAEIDTVTYATAQSSIYVDLARDGGYAQGLANQTEHLISFENVTGATDFINSLHGNEQDNVLIGGNNADWLTGRGGNNTLDGKAGDDLADYLETNQSVTVDLTLGKATHNGSSVDTLISIENIRGTNLADTFIGDDNANYFHGMNGDDVAHGRGGADQLIGSGDNDMLFGDDGDDLLIGEQGRDTLDGGAGFDTASYATSTAGVTVYLNTGYGYGGDADGDHLTSIEHVIGSAYNDNLVGTTAAELLEGGDGNDWLTDGGGADTLLGGAGDDYFFVGKSVAKVDGGAGWDGVIADETTDADGFHFNVAGSNLEYVAGHNGNDMIDARGTDYALSISANGGNDTVYAGDGGNTVWAGDGNDTVHGGAGFDQLLGGEGNDVMDGGGAFGDRLYGEGGNDTLTTTANGWAMGGAGNDTIYGAPGAWLTGDDGDDIIVGGAGDQQIDGGTGDDKLYGDAGNDTIEGGAGRNELYGGAGNDTLRGGSEVDVLDGGDGNDTLIGTGGQTAMFGGDGNDTMSGSLTSSNSMYGGAGNDTFVGGNLTDWVYDTDGGNEIVHAGGGDDIVVDYQGANFLYGEGGDDWIVSAGDQGSLLDGGDGNDKLFASFGGNILLGGTGNDVLEVADGGPVANIFTGGAGADTFVYRIGVGVEANVVVTDFQDGVDHIGIRSQPFDQLTITDSAEGAVISYNGYSPMLLAGVSASQITHDDFLLVA